MLTKGFKKYFDLIVETLRKSHFAGDDLHKLALDYALKMLQLEGEIKLSQAEALKSVVQGESMIRSVRDNALISKANAYVGFLNTMLNATAIANNGSGSSSHSNNVISVINAIDDTYLEGFDESLKELKHDIMQLTKSDGDNADTAQESASEGETPAAQD